MSLLDKLLEKKDVELYLKLRVEFLQKIKHKEVMKEPIENREFIHQRFNGRIDELNMMLNVVKAGKIKDKSKSYFHKINKITPTNDISIVPLRDLSYGDAEQDIIDYIEFMHKTHIGKKVMISELAEKLRLDITLIKEIVSDIYGD